MAELHRKGCKIYGGGPCNCDSFNYPGKIIEVVEDLNPQGLRDKICPRHDLIPLAFLDQLAEIFEEGRRPRPNLPEGYGDSWKLGGEDFLRDCLNHASNHLHLYMEGNRDENHLAKVAWNVLAVRWHRLKGEKGDTK